MCSTLTRGVAFARTAAQSLCIEKRKKEKQEKPTSCAWTVCLLLFVVAVRRVPLLFSRATLTSLLFWLDCGIWC